MNSTDILVIGGGIAGVSAAASFAAHGHTVLLERETALGYHSSGRSATFYHFGIGDDAVRGMTAASGAFFDNPPGCEDLPPLSQVKSAMFFATEETRDQLDALEIAMRRYSDGIETLGLKEMRDIVPVLRVGEGAAVAGLLDRQGRKLDADLLLQANARLLRQAGGEIHFESPVIGLRHDAGRWIVDTPGQSYRAKIIVNAAGAWADELAIMAGVRPLGLTPLRRTIIGFDGPENIDFADWPFLKTVYDDGFYMLPDAGRLLASPMDVTPTPPCDVQPDDYEMALAAWRVEEATNLPVKRIALKWAGLRSFVADKVPTAGYAPDAPGFFWLAGQGGYGLQTSPAMAAAATSLMFDLPWPEMLREQGVRPEQIRPERLFA